MNQLNLIEPKDKTFAAKDYILHPGLKNAVEVAYALGQPLLLTGEPGTGKTKLAFKIAAMLAEQDQRFLAAPLVFNTKTTSSARDLFYTYDAMAHFQAANIDQQTNTSSADFIELQALGKAIAQTNPTQVTKRVFKTELADEKQSAVVLIDEIDKAPRDFSNDILNEIENYEFEIKEQENAPLKKGKGQQILVIMTSNSEKNLPDAFLRRCIFFHIEFPDKDLLFDIIQAQLDQGDKAKFKYTDQALKEIIAQFELIRKKSNRKKPATAELVAWIRILGLNGYMQKEAKAQKELMLKNLSVLVKTQDDLSAIQALLATSLKDH